MNKEHTDKYKLGCPFYGFRLNFFTRRHEYYFLFKLFQQLYFFTLTHGM